MNIDPGLVVVITAVLVFYLRLIVLQRQHNRQSSQKLSAGSKKKGKSQPSPAPERYSMLSSNRSDRAIGIAGAVAILIGILLYAGFLPALQPYWWLPSALGIVAFSWLFKP